MQENDTQQGGGLGLAAAASYQAARDALAMAGNDRQARASAVASGLVDLLVQQAQQGAAIASASLAMSDQARGVWSDILESLQEAGLSPVIYCTRTGRALGMVQPEPWADYLHHIGGLGDAPLGDTLRGRLLSALIAQKAQAVAPVVLHGAGDALAVVRRVSPADFMLRAMGLYLFPMPRGAQSLEHAQRAELLGLGRVAASALPAGALSYACEVVSLVLSHVDTRRGLPELLFYGANPPAVDFAAILASPATVGHFCGRLVQAIVRLLRGKALRPLDKISARDLLALRVDWAGVPEYAALRAERRALIVKERAKADAAFHRALKGSTRGVELLQSEAGRALLDAIDVSLILGAQGQRVPVSVEHASHAAPVLREHAAISALRAEADGLPDDLASLDLAELIAGGAVSPDLLTYQDDGEGEGFALDLAAALESAFSAFDDDDAESLPDDLGGLVSSASLRPVRAPSKPKARSIAQEQAARLSAALLDDGPVIARPVQPGPMVARPALHLVPKVQPAAPVQQVQPVKPSLPRLNPPILGKPKR